MLTSGGKVHFWLSLSLEERQNRSTSKGPKGRQKTRPLPDLQTLHYITLHYITLHYITYTHTHTHIHPYTHIHMYMDCNGMHGYPGLRAHTQSKKHTHTHRAPIHIYRSNHTSKRTLVHTHTHIRAYMHPPLTTVFLWGFAPMHPPPPPNPLGNKRPGEVEEHAVLDDVPILNDVYGLPEGNLK